MLKIGSHFIEQPTVLAPMAGVTDRVFRQLCRAAGAGMATSEMISSDSRLWHSLKTKSRLDHRGEVGPICVQILGNDPQQMADAAQLNVINGAQIIDINMGCPAKKVCNKAAGSALLRDEFLVADILTRVVNAVSVPVTLKIRTGWSATQRNAIEIARLAESLGIQALTVHGRTGVDRFNGHAEYDTIAAVKQAVSIPVIANGDINSPQKAAQILRHTQADAIMIGRAAQGNPWLFTSINHFLRTGQCLSEPSWTNIHSVIREHLLGLYELYGEDRGVRIARKHLGWYLSRQGAKPADLKIFNQLTETQEQLAALDHYVTAQQEQAA